jgi:hypothetical protein
VRQAAGGWGDSRADATARDVFKDGASAAEPPPLREFATLIGTSPWGTSLTALDQVVVFGGG